MLDGRRGICVSAQTVHLPFTHFPNSWSIARTRTSLSLIAETHIAHESATPFPESNAKESACAPKKNEAEDEKLGRRKEA
ncbi:hypothetical protein TNCV_219121 [Trichonephila clavipes]|nr:hypothetical protein TNCV_219121 [Trichonephila clavipes]